MYNEYLEECIKDNKGNIYLLRNYLYSKKNNFTDLIIDDLGFMYNNPKEINNFKEEILKSKIKNFILINSSSGLMDILHCFDSINIKVKDTTELCFVDCWNKEKHIKGLKMIIREK